MDKTNVGASRASSSTGTLPSPDKGDHNMPSSPGPHGAEQCPAPSSSKKRKQATSTTPEAEIPKEAAERSWVWAHITKCIIKETKEVEKDGKKVVVEVSVLKAKCNYCGQMFACDTRAGGTSTYSKHILKVCKKYKPTEDLQQKVLGISVGGDGDVRSMLTCKGWTQEASVKAIAEFIVIDEQPFSVVEKKGFKRMMSVVQPRLCVPSRRTIVRELWKMYDDMKDALKKDISKMSVVQPRLCVPSRTISFLDF